jgi:hypothetical protein
MDLGDPWILLSGLLIGGIGVVLFLYGKKQVNFKCLATGAVLCVFPYFVSSLLLMWVITGVCLGALYLSSRWA